MFQNEVKLKMVKLTFYSRFDGTADALWFRTTLVVCIYIEGQIVPSVGMVETIS